MRLRPPRPDDAQAVLAVLVARDVADIGRPDVTFDDVTSDWDMPGIEADLDCFVAEDQDGTVVGYAVVDRRGANVSVHPRHEGRGVGTMLRQAVERRMAERGEPLMQAIAATNTAAVEHLRAAGYERRHVYQRMRAPLEAVPPPAEEPAIRRFDLDVEGDAVNSLIEDAFMELDGNVREPADAWRAWAARHTEAQYRLVIEDADGLAAAATGERWEDGVGYVAELAVAPRARGRGYGRALLLALAHAFRAEGLHTMELSVHGTNAPATGLYESVGMSAQWRAERWQRRVRGA